MARILPCLVGITALTPLLSGTFAPAAGLERSHSFKLTMASHLDEDIQGKTVKIDADIVLKYTWKQSGRERTLSFDSAFIKLHQDGKEEMNIFMSREKFTNTAEGKTDEVLLDKASEPLKKVLQDSFGAPLCKLQVDQNGKEVKREVSAGPGAKSMIDQGMIANALLFHPPFSRTRNQWSATTEVSMGNGGYAKGKLIYQKAAKGKAGQVVKVSGTLTNEGFQPPGSPVAIKKAEYVVHGEETYDLARGEWVAGKLVLDVAMEMAAGDQPGASAKGTMVLRLERISGKK